MFNKKKGAHKFRVTQDQIDTAEIIRDKGQCVSNYCPIALAMAGYLGTSEGECKVLHGYASYLDRNFKLSFLTDWRRKRFDNKKKLKPFTAVLKEI